MQSFDLNTVYECLSVMFDDVKTVAEEKVHGIAIIKMCLM